MYENEIPELINGNQYLVYHTDSSSDKFNKSEIMEWRGASFHDSKGNVHFYGSVQHQRLAYDNEKIEIPKNKEYDFYRRHNERRKFETRSSKRR